MLGKRGQGIQFNWIFLLVAGFLMLAFLVGFAVRYVDLSEKQNSLKIEFTLDEIIEGVKSQDQYRTFSVGNEEFNLRYTCNTDSSSRLSVNNQVGIPIQDIIFVKDEDYQNMVIWSEEFKQPYKIANIVYLIDNDKSYYLGSNLDTPNLVNEVTSSDDADVKVGINEYVWFDDTNVYYGTGEVFDISDFNDDVIRIGAVFSSPETFECNLEKLKNKRVIIDTIYQEKANTLTGCNYNLLDFEGDRDDLELINKNLANQECEVVF